MTCAGCTALLAVLKILIVISRLQLQGELQSKLNAPRLYKGVFHGVTVIARNEGLRGLFRGIGAAVSSGKSSVFTRCNVDTRVSISTK